MGEVGLPDGGVGREDALGAGGGRHEDGCVEDVLVDVLVVEEDAGLPVDGADCAGRAVEIHGIGIGEVHGGLGSLVAEGPVWVRDWRCRLAISGMVGVTERWTTAKKRRLRCDLLALGRVWAAGPRWICAKARVCCQAAGDAGSGCREMVSDAVGSERAASRRGLGLLISDPGGLVGWPSWCVLVRPGASRCV